jgi:hypothetical protein
MGVFTNQIFHLSEDKKREELEEELKSYITRGRSMGKRQKFNGTKARSFPARNPRENARKQKAEKLSGMQRRKRRRRRRRRRKEEGQEKAKEEGGRGEFWSKNWRRLGGEGKDSG